MNESEIRNLILDALRKVIIRSDTLEQVAALCLAVQPALGLEQEQR